MGNSIWTIEDSFITITATAATTIWFWIALSPFGMCGADLFWGSSF
jgi:hypothetical protein